MKKTYPWDIHAVDIFPSWARPTCYFIRLGLASNRDDDTELVIHNLLIPVLHKKEKEKI